MAPLQINNPYVDAFDLPWFKGDLHIHSTVSDGKASPDQIMTRLGECGFDFAAFAEHDAYHPGAADSDPVLLGNAEMRGRAGEVLSLFGSVAAMPDASSQQIITAINAAGGFPILAHPKIGEFTKIKQHWAYTSSRLVCELTDYAGIEIYTHNVGSGFQFAVDRLDALWTYRCNCGEGPVGVWGFAGSDSHGLESIGPNVGILAAASDCTAAALRQAITAGRFYSLAGSPARFAEISCTGDSLRFVVDGAKMVRLIGVPQSRHTGPRRTLAIAWDDGSSRVSLDYRIRGSEGFVRAEAIDAEGAAIFANPIQIM